MSTIQNLRKSLVKSWKPVCSLVGDAFSGAEFAPFASLCLLPLAGDGRVHRRLALLWDCSVLPLFCEWPAVCSGRLTFSLSLVIPQFKLPSHVSSLRLPSRHSGLVLALSNAARSSITTPFLGWVSVPSSFVSLFIFYILSYLL